MLDSRVLEQLWTFQVNGCCTGVSGGGMRPIRLEGLRLPVIHFSRVLPFPIMVMRRE
jgi:hypothetical protein